jgi:hypothetical protein
MLFVNTSSVSHKACCVHGARFEKAAFRNPHLYRLLFLFYAFATPLHRCPLLQDHCVYFIQNLIRSNTPICIPNDVSGHCYMVNAVQTLLLEKLRRKQKILLRKIMNVGVVNVQFHVNPAKNRQSSSKCSSSPIGKLLSRH